MPTPYRHSSRVLSTTGGLPVIHIWLSLLITEIVDLEEIELPTLDCQQEEELDWGQPAGETDNLDQTKDRTKDVDLKWETCGVISGISELDFMSRQRYLDAGEQSCFIRSQESLHSQRRRPTTSSSAHKFIQEQRKIIKTFKAQPWSMTIKIAATRHYKTNILLSEPEMDKVDLLLDRTYKLYRWTKKRGTEIRNWLTIGNRYIKSIEGRFGSSVASFFTFLRWLCALNLLLTVLVLVLMVIPQITAGHGLDVPQEVQETRTLTSFVFDGKGTAFEYSVLFYGFYDSGQNEPYSSPPPNPHPFIGLGYKLPLAYILSNVILFVVSTGTILMNMAEKYKLLQRTKISEHYPFSWRLFAGWDHAITHGETALLKSCHITTSLRETISEMEKVESKHDWKKILVRVMTNIVVLLILGGTSYCIVLAVENLQQQSPQRDSDLRSILTLDGLWNFLLSFQVQVVVVARNFILPWVFIGVEYMERHHPRTALKLMLVRMFLMYTTSLYVLIIALLTLTQLCGIPQANPTNTTSGYTLGNSSVNISSQSVPDDCCWETTVGQEFYKLSWSHLGAEFGSLLAADVLRYVVVLIRPFKRFGPAEFNLATNILKLVYGQALVWMGVLFCPLLPAITLVKCLSLFYIRVYVVRYLNRPPKAMFRVASTRNFYMLLLLLMVFLCVFPVGYAAMRMLPSNYCGPFRGLSTMMQTIDNEIMTWPSTVQLAIEYIKTSSVLIPLFSLLCVIIYYYAALSNALVEVNKDLILQLHVERTDAKERVAKESIAKKKAFEHNMVLTKDKIDKLNHDGDQVVTNSNQFLSNQNNDKIRQPPHPQGIVERKSGIVVNHIVVNCD